MTGPSSVGPNKLFSDSKMPTDFPLLCFPEFILGFALVVNICYSISTVLDIYPSQNWSLDKAFLHEGNMCGMLFKLGTNVSPYALTVESKKISASTTNLHLFLSAAAGLYTKLQQ